MTDVDALDWHDIATPPGQHRRRVKRRRPDNTNPRAKGSNPRARGANPRRKGTAPSGPDPVVAGRMRRRALARYRTREGRAWCLLCDDTGWVEPELGAGVVRCPSHREMTDDDAWDVLDA